MKQCTHCGKWFEPKYENLKLCLSCYRKRERALEAIDGIEAERDALREQLLRELAKPLTTAPQPIPEDKLRLLIQLAHPDKHGGSRAATEITSWLLSLRRAAA